MALIQRFAHLFTADMHAVLDQLEEPRALLRQAIRDMAAEVAALEQRCDSLRGEQQRWRHELQSLEQRLTALGEELDLSFAAGREDLCREVLRRRLQLERRQQQLQQLQQQGEAQLKEWRQQLEQQRQQLNTLREQASLFTDEPPSPGTDNNTVAVSEADIDLALLREQRARSDS
ncbi:MAG: hypothetical protein Tsb002_19120 [Wenzhouxiangellaceae bacterium]